jgi:hypothetical protein
VSETSAYQRDDFGGILRELVGQLFVVGDEMGNVNVAVVLLHEHILPDLVSVNKDIVEMEVHDKVDEGLLEARRGAGILMAIANLAAVNGDGVGGLSVSHCVFFTQQVVMYEVFMYEVGGGNARRDAPLKTRRPFST